MIELQIMLTIYTEWTVLQVAFYLLNQMYGATFHPPPPHLLRAAGEDKCVPRWWRNPLAVQKSLFGSVVASVAGGPHCSPSASFTSIFAWHRLQNVRKRSSFRNVCHLERSYNGEAWIACKGMQISTLMWQWTFNIPGLVDFISCLISHES